MACQLGPRAKLTCLWQVLRFDHRALSYERSGPVHKPLRLELSLLQRKGYLLALGGLRVLWVVARRTKCLWDDISPYSIVSVHVAFHQRLEGIVAYSSQHVFNVQNSSTFRTISFLLYEALAPLLRIFALPVSTWEISSPPFVLWTKVPPPIHDYILESSYAFIMIILLVLELLCVHSILIMLIDIPVSLIVFLEFGMCVAFIAWMCVCICLLFFVLDTLYDGLPNHVPLGS